MASSDGADGETERLRRCSILVELQGEYIKTWRCRWFVLKQGRLFWFKESSITRASRPRGVIPVATCLTVKGAEDI
ncbi:hypothetical protein Gorai_013164 [Gossypium raimondii]|uniref:PH domain-containing protein n=1 Tax=Gossypium raimondii TaxID=29730 RepID=A0A7J8Q505_GOSRA|nr:hypothetical protein [Gossypium raimondii]